MTDLLVRPPRLPDREKKTAPNTGKCPPIRQTVDDGYTFSIGGVTLKSSDDAYCAGHLLYGLPKELPPDLFSNGEVPPFSDPNSGKVLSPLRVFVRLLLNKKEKFLTEHLLPHSLRRAQVNSDFMFIARVLHLLSSLMEVPVGTLTEKVLDNSPGHVREKQEGYLSQCLLHVSLSSEKEPKTVLVDAKGST